MLPAVEVSAQEDPAMKTVATMVMVVAFAEPLLNIWLGAEFAASGQLRSAHAA